MKRTYRYTIIFLIAVFVGLVVINAVNATAEADAQIAQVDRFIEEHTTASYELRTEPETVSLSYEEWKTQQMEEVTTVPDYSAMDVWQLGATLYGISELDTTRALKIITYEGYGNSPLSYYVACCCWVRATENCWGYPDLYEAFGEADSVSNGGQYGSWMDEIEIADWAYNALRECYLNPSYVMYCNGMMIPDSWVYEEGGIYVW